MSESQTKPTKSRDLSLDLLRALAILLVFGAHVQHPAPAGSVAQRFGAGLAVVGPVGVDLFFVLSGFLIGGLLFQEERRHQRIDVGRFLVRRGLKIYPAYFVFICYVILMPTLKALHGGHAWEEFIHRWNDHWPNLLFLHNYIGDNPEGHTWSLAVEEHFYLVLPLLLVVLIQWRKMHWIVPASAVLLLASFLTRWMALSQGVDIQTVYIESHTRIDALFVGVALRYLEVYCRLFDAPRPVLGFLFIAVGTGAWCLAFAFQWPDLMKYSWLLTVRTLGSACLLLGAWLLRPLINKVSEMRWGMPVKWLATIGVYSYGIYLWHITAMRGLEKYLGETIRRRMGISDVSWTLECLVYGCGALAIGILLSRLIEWPLIGFRDRVFPSATGSTRQTASSASGEAGHQMSPTFGLETIPASDRS